MNTETTSITSARDALFSLESVHTRMEMATDLLYAVHEAAEFGHTQSNANALVALWEYMSRLTKEMETLIYAGIHAPAEVQA